MLHAARCPSHGRQSTEEWPCGRTAGFGEEQADVASENIPNEGEELQAVERVRFVGLVHHLMRRGDRRSALRGDQRQVARSDEEMRMKSMRNGQFEHGCHLAGEAEVEAEAGEVGIDALAAIMKPER